MKKFYSNLLGVSCVKPILALLVLILFAAPLAYGQCDGLEINLPDENQPVSNPSVSYCTTIPVDPSATGHPSGLVMDLFHTYQGDLSIRINACGETLMLLTRPGGGTCNGQGCPCGSSADVNGTFVFSDNFSNDPDNGLALGGGNYGLSGDPCSVGTISSFAELATACGGGPYILEICITDHAFINTGVASNIILEFPGIVTPICGCTDPVANNYDPLATVDDGTCEYNMGCTDPAAINYDPTAVIDDGSCVYPPSCGGTFTDSGGPTGNYSNAENNTITICPDVPGQVVTVTFSAFNLENNYDFLRVYNGNSTASPQLGQFTGTSVPGPFVSTSPDGCLTFNFTSDGSLTRSGWIAAVECDAACVPPPPPTAANVAVCVGSSATLTASGCPSGTLRWYTTPSGGSPVATGPTFTTPPLNSTTTYYVECDNGGPGCQSSRTPVTVNVSLPPPPVAQGVSVCQGSSATLAASGCPGGTLRWYTSPTGGSPVGSGPTFVTPVLNASTTYYVLCDEGGTCLSDRVAVPVTVTPPVPPQLDSFGPYCIEDGPIILPTTQGGVNGTWSGTGVSQGFLLQPELIQPGTTVTLTFTPDPSTCYQVATATVQIGTPPFVQISGPETLCNGETAFLSVPNSYGTYMWSTGLQTFNTPINSPGTYTVTVTDPVSGCENTASFTVGAGQAPTPVVNGPQELCDGQSATLSLAGSYDSYMWSTGDGTPTTGITGPGAYSVTVTDNGCEGVAQFTVAETQVPLPDLSGPASLCPGEAAVLSVNNAGQFTTFSWSNAGQSASVNINGPGTYTLTAQTAGGCSVQQSITVGADPVPSPVIDPGLSFCTGGSVPVTTNQAFATYEWSTGDQTPATTVTAGGIVTVTVTNAAGCTGFASANITENPLPDVAITGDAAVCSGDPATLSVVDGNNYSSFVWSNNSPASSITVGSAGTYSVTATDLNGCANSASFNVTVSTLPAAGITGETVFCEGESVTLTAAAPGLGYTWSDNSSGQSITVSTPGTYSLTVENAAGCQSVNSITVSQNLRPQPQITGPLNFCDGASTTLTAAGGPYSSYSWSNMATGANATFSQTGQVTLVVEDANGCVGSAAVTVVENPLPPVQLIGQPFFCEGGSTALNVAPGYANYQWNIPNNGTSAIINTPGLVQVTVTDQNGCMNSATQLITAHPSPEPMIAGNPSFCTDGSTVLNVPGDFDAYSWSTGSQSAATLVEEPGLVSVTVTDGNGCTGSSSVLAEENAELSFAITGPAAICEGQSTTLGTSFAFDSYTWSDGSQESTLEVAAPGVISVTVVDASGCSGTAELEVVNSPNPIAEINGTLEFCEGESTVLSGPPNMAGYSWSNGSESPAVQVSSAGAYQLVVQNAFGCADTAMVSTVVNPLPEPDIEGQLAFCADTSAVLSLGGAFESYTWSDGSTAETYEATVTESISVTVSNAFNCTASDTVEVVVYDLPIVEITGDDAFCAGSSATINATPGLAAYSWSDNGEGAERVVTAAGVYQVTVADAQGCQSIAAFPVEELPLPPAAITGGLSFCEGDSTILTAPAGFAYTWSGAATAQSITVTAPGIYELTVTDAAGCEASDAVSVVANPNPEPEIQGLTAFCPGEVVTLSLNGPFVSYDWSDGSSGAFITVDTALEVSVTVANAFGCTGSAQIETALYPQPSVQIVGDTAFCAGESVLLHADQPFVGYNWSTGSGADTLEMGQPGPVFLVVTDENGCTAGDQVTLTENALPQPTILGQDYFCEGSALPLSASGSYSTYSWSNGAVGDTALVQSPGIVALSVTDGNGCEGQTSLLVSEAPLPVPIITGEPAFCPGEAAEIGLQQWYPDIQWSTGDTTAAVLIDEVGLLNVTVTDELGCTGSAALDIAEHQTAAPQIDGPGQICPGTTASLMASPGFAAYLWEDGTASSTFEAGGPGIYSLTVTDANGCETASSFAVDTFATQPPAITGPAGFCADTSAVLALSNSFESYYWSNGSSADEISVAQGGSYSVTVTDANGCETASSYVIDRYELPTAEVDAPEAFCPEGSATLNAVGSFAAYQWSDGSSGSMLTVVLPGQYQLTVTDQNGCTDDVAVEIGLQADLQPVIQGAEAFCPGQSLQLNVPQSFATYTWSNGATGAVLEIEEPGAYTVSVTDGMGCSGDTSIVVSLYPEPEAGIIAPEGFCETTAATLQSVPGSWQSWEWSNGGTQSGTVVSEPGNYILIATDLNGCRDTAMAEIVSYPLPEVEIAGTPYFCEGAATVLSGPAGLSAYFWNGEPGGPSLNVDGAGSYTLQVVDENGCESGASLQVVEVALPNAEAGQPGPITCSSPEVTLGSPGNPAFGVTYTWSGPGIDMANANLAAPTVQQGGWYQLIITDTVHNCISEPATVEVAEDNTAPDADINGEGTLTCVVDRITLAAEGYATGGDIEALWYNQSGEVLAFNAAEIEVSGPGQYILELIDAGNGCAALDTVQVLEDRVYPQAEAGPSARLDCQVSSVSLDGSGPSTSSFVEYFWTGPGGALVSQNGVATVSSPGLYYLEVVDISNGCATVDSVQVTQDITPPVADAGAPQQIDCHSPDATLNGSGSSTGSAFTYQWGHGSPENVVGNGLSLTVSEPGAYFLVVTNTDNHCSSTASVVVEEVASAPSALAAFADGVTCFGDQDGSLAIGGIEGGTPPYLYSLGGQPFSTQTLYTGLGGGDYQLVIQDAIGCEYDTLITVPQGNDLRVELGTEINISLGDEVALQALINIPAEQIGSIWWEAPDSLSCYDCLRPVAAPSLSGLYEVTVTDINGCVATDAVQVFVDKRRQVYIPNIFSPNGDGANDVFYIQTGPEVVKVNSFEVYSRWGEPVFTVYNAPPNDPRYGWPGVHRGELMNSGVFTWWAEIEYIDGKREIFKGDVVLMR
ncbi:Ig-like domain-containing protein [Phaeodactylibacter luteus]|uniref:CUB domain-containing protein n=1 Tax=Phaeodactylibacter luteus TaxID=1564516 RepID=A0A5C6RKL5_9BACT|nr:gliding motility-associated C-terminal domain-containing protein [Phaeodactylibacter luteus]TXB62783.1 hypothetical protein FRY97_12545 [Phaeodactylibacter luteus]